MIFSPWGLRSALTVSCHRQTDRCNHLWYVSSACQRRFSACRLKLSRNSNIICCQNSRSVGKWQTGCQRSRDNNLLNETISCLSGVCVCVGGGVTKLPLKPFKGAKLVLTSVMPCRWKRVPFVINEVTNHFIKRLFTHTHLGELIPPPPLLPSPSSTGSHY